MLFPLFIKRWFRPFDLHTRSLTNRFVCNFLSSSAGFNLCSCFFPTRPCLAAFSGLPLSRPVAASASLSDPRCFRALSTASVLGSDYSASVSSFPCFLSPPHSGFLSAAPPLSLPGFPRSLLPGFPCIPSRFRYSASPYVSFRPSLIRSHDRSSGAHFQLSLSMFSASRSLPFVRSRSASGYSACCFFLSVLPASASQWLPRCASPLSLPGFPRSSRPDLSCLLSRFPYSALLFVSFRPTLLRSRSRSTGDPLSDRSSGAGA